MCRVAVDENQAPSSNIDDQLSLFSVDQEGFYTSMHADSGLLSASVHHAEISSPPLAINSSSSEQTISEDANYASVAAASNQSTTSVLPMTTDVNDTPKHCAGSEDDDGLACSSTKHDNEASNADVIRAEQWQCGRSSFMSLVTITPSPSSDEDEDLTKKTLSTPPSILSHCAVFERKTSTDKKSHDITIPRSVKNSQTRYDDVSTDNGFSTWPCSPVTTVGSDESSIRGILKVSSSSWQSKDGPRSIKFNPVSSFYCNSSCSSLLSDSRRPSLISPDNSPTRERRAEEAQSSSGVQATSNGPRAVAARLVISSPIAKKSSYIENDHKRMVCRRISRDELTKLDVNGCSSRTLPHRRKAESDSGRKRSHSTTVAPNSSTRVRKSSAVFSKPICWNGRLLCASDVSSSLGGSSLASRSCNVWDEFDCWPSQRDGLVENNERQETIVHQDKLDSLSVNSFSCGPSSSPLKKSPLDARKQACGGDKSMTKSNICKRVTLKSKKSKDKFTRSPDNNNFSNVSCSNVSNNERRFNNAKQFTSRALFCDDVTDLTRSIDSISSAAKKQTFFDCADHKVSAATIYL